MRKFSLRHSCALGALTVAAISAVPALAQEAAGASDEGTDETRIVVTGSYIRGTPEDAAVPVAVVTAEELQNKGISSPLELIKELPSVGSVLGDTNQFSVAAQGFQGNGSINLRGLGATRTLVLLNGKRMIQAPGDGFTDTNLIPLFALQRVEILKDGAAATYGSDAIAGVANFITRTNFDGVEVAGDYTFVSGSDGNYNVSALVGKNFGDLNVMVGAGWQHRSELATTERDYTSQSYDVNASGYSALATPGLFAVTYSGAGTVFAPDSGCNELGGFYTAPVCRFTYIPFDNITEEEDRYQVYAQADADLSDTVRWHAGALWAKTDLESLNYSPAFPPTQGPKGSGFVSAFSTSPSNPAVAAFLTQKGLPLSGGANGTVLAVTNVYYRPFGFIGNPRDPERGAGQGLAKNNAWRVSTGFEIDVGDNLVLNIDGTYWRSARTAYAPGIVGSRLQAALNGFGGPNCTGSTAGQNGCQWFNPFVLAGPSNPTLDIANPFYVPGFENDPDLVAWLQVPNGTFQREEQWVGDIVLAGGTGLQLPGGEVNFAVGAQYRKNNFISRPLNDLSNLNINPCFIEGDQSCVGTATDGVGPFIFLGGTRPVSLDQSVYAFFGEVQLPILDNLELTAAIRYEDYGSPIGSTINPKAAARFEATDWLTLRGSIGTTFRGPLASNVDPNFVTALQGLTATGGNYKSVDIYGNPNLDPETALTYNVGFIVETGGLTFSTDFWTYEFKDQIVITPADAIASFVGNGQTSGTLPVNCSSVLVDLITFSGNACTQGVTTGLDIARVRTQYVNGPDVTVRGLDFAANYDIEAGFGLISIGATATWTLNYKTDDFFVNDVLVTPAYDAVGFGNYFRDPGTLPEWRGNGYVNLRTGELNLRYSVNYIDSVFDERCTGDPCFAISGVPAGSNYGKNSGSYMQHDLVANYSLPIEGMDVQLTAAVLNIFDEEPAQAYLPLGYNPFIGNAIGRNYRLGIRTKF
ncbi:TonB-dependent receptor domain-containing protein [Erythrobacter mangrovi]|uniref:TonB-dependent receptor n=1 Tax=Erythrobacter mangrovi TaxID=2739433 RepID=A0A7D3XMY1_9SPHN|nr:TonB-dependent receptor [Erythrobacter mangrovi]QKG69894.1 TonB-dependent receptor [Erythrobacter mangrovi]